MVVNAHATLATVVILVRSHRHATRLSIATDMAVPPIWTKPMVAIANAWAVGPVQIVLFRLPATQKMTAAGMAIQPMQIRMMAAIASAIMGTRAKIAIPHQSVRQVFIVLATAALRMRTAQTVASAHAKKDGAALAAASHHPAGLKRSAMVMVQPLMQTGLMDVTASAQMVTLASTVTVLLCVMCPTAVTMAQPLTPTSWTVANANALQVLAGMVLIAVRRMNAVRQSIAVAMVAQWTLIPLMAALAAATTVGVAHHATSLQNAAVQRTAVDME